MYLSTTFSRVHVFLGGERGRFVRFVSSSLSLQPQAQVLQYVGVGASSRGRRELVQLLEDAVVCWLDHQLQTAVQFSKDNEIERYMYVLW